MKSWMIAGWVMAGAVAAFVPAVAEACICGFGVRGTSPADGSTDVPTNTEIRVRVLGPAPTGFVLERDGQSIPMTKAVVGELSVTVVRLRPIDPLEPTTSYELKAPDGHRVVTFTTGAGPDHVPPNPPEVRGAEQVDERGRTVACDPTYGYRIDLGPGLDDNTPQDDVWFLVYAGPTPEQIDLEHPRAVFLRSWAHVGVQSCHNELLFSEEGFLAIVLRAVDRAGNASAPTEPMMLTAPPEAASCGCGTSGGDALIGWSLAAAMLSARRASNLVRTAHRPSAGTSP
jgi:hypothetical protein